MSPKEESSAIKGRADFLQPDSYDEGMEHLSQIPFALTASSEGHWRVIGSPESLSVTALAQTDLYCNPKDGFSDGAPATLDALTLLGKPESEDFQISAKVEVQFDSDYDAGVLLIWDNPKTWAKLCFEFSPDKEAMVVSVVTRGASDDVNSFTLPINEVWLRISRLGEVYAFHASTDALVWKLIRVFTLGSGIENHQVGFVAQAPIGNGCDVTFSDIRFAYSSLAQLRDGS